MFVPVFPEILKNIFACVEMKMACHENIFLADRSYVILFDRLTNIFLTE